MVPREILKLRSSEIAGNVYFTRYFASSESSRKATKLHDKGHFVQDFEKCGGPVPLYPPVPTSMDSMMLKTLSQTMAVM